MYAAQPKVPPRPTAPLPPQLCPLLVLLEPRVAAKITLPTFSRCQNLGGVLQTGWTAWALTGVGSGTRYRAEIDAHGTNTGRSTVISIRPSVDLLSQVLRCGRQLPTRNTGCSETAELSARRWGDKNAHALARTG